MALLTSKMPRDSWCKKVLAATTNKATRAGWARGDGVGAQDVVLHADGSNESGRRGRSGAEGAESVLKRRETLMEVIAIILPWLFAGCTNAGVTGSRHGR